MRTIARLMFAVAGLCALGACNPAASDEDDIRAVMRQRWDRPEAPLNASPIAVSGDYAVADWTQGESGGRALLERRGGAWRVVLCAGDALRTAEGLAGAGVPAQSAAALARALTQAERSVSADRLGAMARFEGVVRMD